MNDELSVGFLVFDWLFRRLSCRANIRPKSELPFFDYEIWTYVYIDITYDRSEVLRDCVSKFVYTRTEALYRLNI